MLTVGPGGLFEIQAVSGSVPATGATVIQLGGTYTFTQAGGVALDSGGNLFVTDDGAGDVFELAPPYTATLANPLITGLRDHRRGSCRRCQRQHLHR